MIIYKMRGLCTPLPRQENDSPAPPFLNAVQLRKRRRTAFSMTLPRTLLPVDAEQDTR